MRDQTLLAHAKTMRRELTGPELKLWLELRAKRLIGAKFRRQVVIGPYIADFACRSSMLALEIDGDTHAGRAYAPNMWNPGVIESSGSRTWKS